MVPAEGLTNAALRARGTIRWLGVVAVIVLASASGLSAGGDGLELFVGPEGDDDAMGQTTETALRSITEALVRARDFVGPSTIWVQPGDYTRETETFPLEPPASVTIAGTDPADRPRIGDTWLALIFWVHDIPAEIPAYAREEIPWPEPDENAVVLQDLILRGATNCADPLGGGAVLVTRGSVALRGCDLIENGASHWGAGVAITEGSKLIASDCRIAWNFGCGGFSDFGTAVHLVNGSIGAFEDCQMHGNDSLQGVGGIQVRNESRLFVRRCRIVDNDGPALRSSMFSTVVAEDSVIAGHTNYGLAAGSLEVIDGHLALRNSLIYANFVMSGLALGRTTAVIDGSTIAWNDSGRKQSEVQGGEQLLAWESWGYPIRITNSIFWGNNRIGERWGSVHFPQKNPGVWILHGEIRYSIVERSTPPWDDYSLAERVEYVEVQDVDPLFIDPRSGDFRLAPGSPGIDAGDPNAPLDPDGTRRDLGAQLGELPPHYIFIRGDPNRDEVIDISDAVMILLGLFSRLELTCPDAADYDDSGRVDLSDAIAVLHNVFRPSGGAWPRRPFPFYGVDWTPDDELGCEW